MRVLTTMHIETEGLGTLGPYLEEAGVRVDTVRLYAGEKLPETPDGYNAIISMGGPMNVYEYDKYWYLEPETRFLRTAISAGTPVLGVCLGAQLIAHALGARISRSPVKEVGWGTVRLTAEAVDDPFFQGLPETLDVFQWHEDTFDVPESGFSMATGAECPNQAFRAFNAYGLQFHVEVDEELIRLWFGESELLPELLSRYEKVRVDLTRNAERLYGNFVNLINGRVS